MQREFVHDFISLWDTRTQRLMNDLTSGDRADADVVLLSIRSSSRMLGLSALEAAAALVHGALKSGDLSQCLPYFERMSRIGHETCAELRELMP